MRKRKVAVFDFNTDDGNQTAKTVREYFWRQKVPADVVVFSMTQEFAYSFRDERPDMVFITVNNMMGVETARLIREIDPFCPLFFISDVVDYGTEGYRLHVLDYLIKPITARRVEDAVKRIGAKCLEGLQKQQSSHLKDITIKNKQASIY